MKKGFLSGRSGDAILLTMIKLVTMVLGLAVTRLLSQYLSIYDYGSYSQVLLIVSTVSSVTIMGMMDGVNYFYCRERDEQKREAYVATIFALQCMVSAIAGAAVMLLSGPICRYLDNPDLRRLLYFAVSLPFLQNLLFMFQVLLVAVGKARMLAFRNLIVSLVRLAAVIFVVMVARDVVVILLATLLLDVGQLLFFGGVLRKNSCYIRIRSVNLQLVKQILLYCIPMGIFVALRSLNRDMDKYLIALVMDPENLAIYANASKVLPFDVIIHSFHTVLVPEITMRVAAKDNERARILYKDFLEIGYITTVILCCAALAAAPQLMKLLYSNKYMSGLTIFCIYILVDMLQFTNTTLILTAAGKTKVLMLLAGCMLVLNAVLNAILYKSMGMVGPALATLVVTLITGAVMLKLGAKELETKVRKFFDLKFLGIFILENALLLMILIPLQKILSGYSVYYMFTLFIVAFVYCGASLLINGKRIIKLLKSINAK